MSLHRIRLIIWKEFLQLRRDPLLLRLIFIMPIVQLIFFGYVVSADVRNLATAVVDLDKSAIFPAAGRVLLEFWLLHHRGLPAERDRATAVDGSRRSQGRESSFLKAPRHAWRAARLRQSASSSTDRTAGRPR